MPTYKSRMAANPSIQSAQAGQEVVQYGTYDFAVADAKLEDVAAEFLLVRLPAQHRISSLVIALDDLESAATLTFDVGLKDDTQEPADTTDLTLFAAALSGQAASYNTYANTEILDVAAVDYDRYIAVNVAAAAAAGLGLAGSIRARLVSRPDHASHEGNFD